MHISFTPQRRDDALVVSKAGDVLTVNGEAFDFSTLPEGAILPAGTVPCEFIVGPVGRSGGEIELTLILPHGASPTRAVAFPEPIDVTAGGPVAIPGQETEHVDA